MPRMLFIFIFISFSIKSFCQERQIEYPALSPLQKTEVRVGIVDIKLKYCRPSMKGRKIFGGLVPLNKVWRTGANKNTKLTISDKVLVAGNPLPPGSYSIFTIPNTDNWEVIFYSELDEYGVPDIIDNSKIIIQFTVPRIALDMKVESLSLNFESFTPTSSNLAIEWENSRILIPIEIPNDEIITTNLQKEINTLVDDYWAAADIYFRIDKKYPEALDAINHSISLLEDNKSFEEYIKNLDLNNRHLPNKYLLKSEILAALKDFDKAIEAAQRSLILTELVDDAYYRGLNKDNLKKWEKQ